MTALSLFGHFEHSTTERRRFRSRTRAYLRPAICYGEQVRRFIIIATMLLALIGSSGAAYASALACCIDSPAAVQSASAGTDCDMGHHKAPACTHNACCAYCLAAISDVRDFSTPPLPSAPAVASLTQDLASSGEETLLDPPRA